MEEALVAEHMLHMPKGNCNIRCLYLDIDLDYICI